MDSPAVELEDVRDVHRLLEQFHAVVYFSHLAADKYRACDLQGSSAYFASRSAALGPVPPQVVAAAFFNFSPPLVEAALEGVWDRTSPTAVLRARLQVAHGTLREHLGPDVVRSEHLQRAAELARQVAEIASTRIEGRPLFAAHASLPWPDDPLDVLWHAATLLREFRGDAHIAALVTAGLDGLDAIVINAASRQIPAAFLRTTRGWSDAEWNETVDLHRSTGWLAPAGGENDQIALSADGTTMREEIEIATDRASAAPWLSAGADHLRELSTLITPWATTLSDSLFVRLGT